jgi:hypothetical protein
MHDHRGYQTVNILFAVLIVLILIYSLVYPPSGGHPLPSLYTLLSGEPSPTAGLSRSFSALVRGQFSLARQLSPYGIPLFLFFFVELLMRVASFVLLAKSRISLKKILIPDVILSMILFLLCYGGMAAGMIKP